MVSNRSGKINRKADVDETLFAQKRVSSAQGSTRKQEIEKLQNELKTGEIKNPNAIVISQSELARMKNNAITLTTDERLHQQKILEEQNEKMMAAAKAKKQKMLELEAERKKEAKPSESELNEHAKGTGLRNKAEELLNEQRDEVKHMNHLILQAKIVTIRDAQLVEKQEIKDSWKQEEKRKDLLLELERLKKVKYYDELEVEKKKILREGSSVVIDQIKERQLERLKIQEEKEREGQEMLKHIKQLQREEGENNLKRKAR